MTQADFKAALAGGIRAEALPDGDEKCLAKATAKMFDFCVDFFRQGSNEALRQLASQLWTTVNRRIVQVALWPGVNVVTISVVQREGVVEALILLPTDWLQRVAKDCVNELGAILYTGSQAVDYANGKLVGHGAEAMNRGRAYEAEYLHMVRRGDPAFAFNKYQREIMRMFPLGLEGVSV